MFSLSRDIDDNYIVRDTKDVVIATYAPAERERAELVVRTLNSEYEAITAYLTR